VAVIQEAWIGGVSTRRVDELVQAMGLSGISKSTVSKLCKDIDERVGAFLDRPCPASGPTCGSTPPTCASARGAHRLGGGDNRRGLRRRRAAPDRRPAHRAVEAETFWAAFLKSLVRRGLKGVKLVVSDAHEG
jgi:hypothetical protein